MKRKERQALKDAELDTARSAAAPGAVVDNTHDDREVSKSQKKRDMTELQALGEDLLALAPAKLRKMPLPPELIEAIELAHRIANSREGLRRQRQYIGRLMREIDPEPIRKALDLDGSAQRAEVALMHAAERWRTRLIDTPDSLAEFLAQQPGADQAAWARLTEEARGEITRGLPGRRYRELYRQLRAALAAR